MVNRKDDDQEMSMEEILASIRKYVTEDDPNAPKSQETAPAPSHEEEEVLDLANLPPVANMPTQSLGQHTGKQHDTPSPVPEQTQSSHQGSSQASAHVHSFPHEAQQHPQHEKHSQESHEVVAPLPTTRHTHESPVTSHEEPTTGTSKTSTLRSETDMAQHSFASTQTKSATAQSLTKLMEKTKAIQQQVEQTFEPMISGGNTVESVAIQAMTPYIKQWLDANLPELVERLVQNEIEKLTKELLQK